MFSKLIRVPATTGFPSMTSGRDSIMFMASIIMEWMAGCKERLLPIREVSSMQATADREESQRDW